jgi:methylphosphotriester-DNA--protein-cysteine methyltransferase
MLLRPVFERITMKVYGNKATKVIHSSVRGDACRFAEISKKNRIVFESVTEAEGAGYRRCKICLK